MIWPNFVSVCAENWMIIVRYMYFHKVPPVGSYQCFIIKCLFFPNYSDSCPDNQSRPSFTSATTALIIDGHVVLSDIYCHVSDSQRIDSYLNLHALNRALSDYPSKSGSMWVKRQKGGSGTEIQLQWNNICTAKLIEITHLTLLQADCK